LPFIDEHRRTVAAPASATWEALRSVVAKNMNGLPSALASIWGLEPLRADGSRPLDTGSPLPGFRVVDATPTRRLILDGRHRFSRYRLEFLLDDAPAGTVLRARSYAVFPGPHGAAYRAVIIGSRGHVVAVRRLLRAIAQRAERR
jgi:hypothetical protein